jgi:fluoroacetyl-CoA thioesterase
VTLEAGIERSDEFTVADRMLTDVGGTLGVKVLSTPGMIAMMERCASILAFENLPDGRATVGFEGCVKHVAAAGEGAACTVHARLDEIVERRVIDRTGFGS